MSFVDATHGWAAGGNSAPAVLSTSDGGRTWQSATPQPSSHPLTDLTFVDVNHGWTIGSYDANSGAPVILATTDGGRTWSQRSPLQTAASPSTSPTVPASPAASVAAATAATAFASKFHQSQRRFIGQPWRGHQAGAISASPSTAAAPENARLLQRVLRHDVDRGPIPLTVSPASIATAQTAFPRRDPPLLPLLVLSNLFLATIVLVLLVRIRVRKQPF